VSADPETLQRAGAGRSANLLEMGHPAQGPDIVVGHLAPGEIVVPPSAQTSEVVAALRAALGDDLPAYTVGSGRERRNPVSGLVAFADTWPVRGYPVPGHPNRRGQMGDRLAPRGGGTNLRGIAQESSAAVEAAVKLAKMKMEETRDEIAKRTHRAPVPVVPKPHSPHSLFGHFEAIVGQIAASGMHGGFGGGDTKVPGPNPKRAYDDIVY
jgi:hypothetical protein